MPKKIYDIKPPRAKKVKKPVVSRQTETKIKEFFDEPQEVKATKPKASAPASRKKEERSLFRPIMFASVLVVLVLAIFLFIKLPKADVRIWPKIETLSFQETIVADKSIAMVDATKNVIPAQYFEVVKDGSQEFPATGNASNEGKASGVITISNKYNPPSPLTLKSGTHFMSDSGKLFVILQKVVVPAAKKSGSKVIPGTIDVKVEAVEGGDSYNIDPSNFSVPGLKGTAFYYSVSASSDKAFTGGYAGKVKKITDDDLQGAKDVLTKKLLDEATSEIKKQITSEYILLDNGILNETINASADLKVGTVTEKFNYKASVKVKSLVFKKSDLDEFSNNYIISKIQQGKSLLDGSLKENYSATKVDISGGTITLKIDFSSDIYQSVDKNSLSVSLMGQNSTQIEQTVRNILGENMDKISVKFWPFWVKSAPNNQKVIHIYTEFK